MSTLKVSTISPLGTDATKTITIGSAGDTIAGVGANIPAFEAYPASDQTGSRQTNIKINFDTKVFDTNNCFDTSNNRFTPTVAGKYYVYTNARVTATTPNLMDDARVLIYKNGSAYKKVEIDPENSADINKVNLGAFAILDLNGTSDYVEIFFYVDTDSGTDAKISGGLESNTFGAYRLIGV